MSDNAITSRLRDLREKIGVNQDTVAEACNISRVALTRYENGQRFPTAKIASRLADFYGVSIDYLLGREESQNDVQKEKAPADKRAEAKAMLESMTDEQYQEALRYLKYLKSTQS